MTKDYQLSAFTLFKDAADYLIEWIEFHKIVGVEHFYLYNHQSGDDYNHVLKYHLDKKEVTLIDWEGDEDLYFVQRRAFRHCIRNVKWKTRWLAFFDVDEFLFPRQGMNLVSVLKENCPWWCSGVSIPWSNFGPSGHTKMPEGLISEVFTTRAEQSYPLNRDVKTIYNPRRIFFLSGYAPHRAKCIPPTRHDASHFQLNHYWTRSEDRLRERARHIRGMVRVSLELYGISVDRAGWEDTLLERIREDYSVRDTNIHRFLPELKKRLGEPAS